MIAGYFALLAPLFTSIKEWISVILGGYLSFMSLLIFLIIKKIIIFLGHSKFEKNKVKGKNYAIKEILKSQKIIN